MRTASGLLVVGVLVASGCGGASDEASVPATTPLARNAALPTSTSAPAATTTQALTTTTVLLVEVPDLVGQTVDFAEGVLSVLGLVLVVDASQETQGESGVIFEQLPEAGRDVTPDTPVVVKVPATVATTTAAPSTTTTEPPTSTTTEAPTASELIDEEAVLGASYPWGSSAEAYTLQGVLGIEIDGFYGSETRTAHLAELEARGMSTTGVPNVVITPKVTLLSTDLSTGETIQVSGSDFQPNSRVEVTLKGLDINVDRRYYVDGGGSFEEAFEINADVGEGAYELVFAGWDRDGQRTVLTFPVVVTQDLTPPEISVSLSTTTVDVSAGDQTILITVEATDEGSGLRLIVLHWVHESMGHQDVQYTLSDYPLDPLWEIGACFHNGPICDLLPWIQPEERFHLVSGSIKDGTWQYEVTVTSDYSPGTWIIWWHSGIQDGAGNMVEPEALATLPIPDITIINTSTPTTTSTTTTDPPPCPEGQACPELEQSGEGPLSQETTTTTKDLPP